MIIIVLEATETTMQKLQIFNLIAPSLLSNPIYQTLSYFPYFQGGSGTRCPPSPQCTASPDSLVSSITSPRNMDVSTDQEFVSQRHFCKIFLDISKSSKSVLKRHYFYRSVSQPFKSSAFLTAMSRRSMTSSPTTSSPPPWTSPWWTWHWPTSPPLALV